MPYNASVRRFALVVSCKSKSAYRWIRQKFSRHLPAIRTLRSWHANSNCSFQFGFNEQSIITLTERVKEGTTEAKNVYVSMCFDEISIRRHIQLQWHCHIWKARQWWTSGGQQCNFFLAEFDWDWWIHYFGIFSDQISMWSWKSPTDNRGDHKSKQHRCSFSEHSFWWFDQQFLSLSNTGSLFWYRKLAPIHFKSRKQSTNCYSSRPTSHAQTLTKRVS